MDKSRNIIVVSGAAGQQGGAVARRLLASGWHVRGLTRDPNKPAARTLASQGAEMVKADLDDRASVVQALKGAYGAFSVQNFWIPSVGFAGEVRQGKAFADAAKEAGIKHLVYSSVGGAERRTGIPHFDSKWQIEEYARSLHLPATIVRPAYFMDNLNRSRSMILNGSLYINGLRPGKTLQMIAVDDIGAFAVLAFDKPEQFVGTATELAGDELTEPQIADTFARVIGRPVRLLSEPPAGAPPANAERNKMVAWFNDQGYEADIPALRKLYPDLTTFETWLRKTGWVDARP